MKYFVTFKILYQIILCLYFSISFGICYHPSLSVACQSHLADFWSNLFTSRILLFLYKMADPWRPIAERKKHWDFESKERKDASSSSGLVLVRDRDLPDRQASLETSFGVT